MNSIKIKDLSTNTLMYEGCLAKVAIPNLKNFKIGSKIVDCVFIRYV